MGDYVWDDGGEGRGKKKEKYNHKPLQVEVERRREEGREEGPHSQYLLLDFL